MSEQSTRGMRCCLVANEVLDNVAVSTKDLFPGVSVGPEMAGVELREEIPKGQRFALRPIECGESVVQYGHSFGISRGIAAGARISSENMDDIEVAIDEGTWHAPPMTRYTSTCLSRTFLGYRRQDGRVGTRNYYLLVPSSQCASQTVSRIAQLASEELRARSDMSNVDGIVAIPNTEGCGCAGNVQIERFVTVLKNFMTHPNVGGVVVVDLGCEQTNYSVLHARLKDGGALPTVPTDWLTIQKEGGVQKTIEKACDIVRRRMAEVNAVSRTQCPVADLVVGTECGASDAFSGITANSVIGNAVDQVVKGKGSVLLSEVPEMIGAEQLLMMRMRSKAVVEKFQSVMAWYKDMADRLDVRMSDNLVLANRAGGLVNTSIKSLGAIVKGGSTAIEAVVDYGERLSARGLSIMQGPGNDLESITGMVASGASLVALSTGKGSIAGSAIVPVVRVSSTTELHDQMPDDIDFDAGRLLERGECVSLETLGQELLESMLDVASGKKTKPELAGQADFQVWTAGKLSL